MAAIGIISMMAFLLEMLVEFLGEGKADMIKHLILANFMFDIATIMLFGLIALHISSRIYQARLYKDE